VKRQEYAQHHEQQKQDPHHCYRLETTVGWSGSGLPGPHHHRHVNRVETGKFIEWCVLLWRLPLIWWLPLTWLHPIWLDLIWLHAIWLHLIWLDLTWRLKAFH
jgi:hypothetical protein